MKLPRLYLDKDTHIYYADGIKVPGTTGTLGAVGVSVYPDTQVMRTARWRGNVVHSSIELYEQDKLDEEQIVKEFSDINAMGFINGYKSFRAECVASIVKQEWLVFHPVYWYAGMLDMLCILNDARLCLIDFKTGSLPWWVDLQLVAYVEALLAMRNYEDQLDIDPNDLWHSAVQLSADGTYRMKPPSQDRSSFTIFRKALEVATYIERKGK